MPLEIGSLWRESCCLVAQVRRSFPSSLCRWLGTLATEISRHRVCGELSCPRPHAQTPHFHFRAAIRWSAAVTCQVAPWTATSPPTLALATYLAATGGCTTTDKPAYEALAGGLHPTCRPPLQQTCPNARSTIICPGQARGNTLFLQAYCCPSHHACQASASSPKSWPVIASSAPAAARRILVSSSSSATMRAGTASTASGPLSASAPAAT